MHPRLWFYSPFRARFLLDQDFHTVVDVEALGRGLVEEAEAIEREPGIFHLTSYIFHLPDARLLVAEVEVEGLDAWWLN